MLIKVKGAALSGAEGTMQGSEVLVLMGRRVEKIWAEPVTKSFSRAEGAGRAWAWPGTVTQIADTRRAHRKLSLREMAILKSDTLL